MKEFFSLFFKGFVLSHPKLGLENPKKDCTCTSLENINLEDSLFHSSELLHWIGFTQLQMYTVTR